MRNLRTEQFKDLNQDEMNIIQSTRTKNIKKKY